MYCIMFFEFSWRLTIFLTCIELVFCRCGSPNVQPSSLRIVGGTHAREGSMPWMVMVLENGKQVCGGSIINERLVLSAAHCFEGEGHHNPQNWTVYVGKYHLNKADATERLHHVSRIIMHEAYDSDSVENDIALLVLSERIMFNDNVMPICLPLDHSTNYHVGQECIAAGWGNTQFTASRDVLNQVTLPILSDHLCVRTDWYGDDFLPLTTFCAGYPDGQKDTCFGDSGGPFICNIAGSWYQMGVTSWGYDCARPKWPGIYTDVPVYSQWIREKLLLLGERI